MLETELGKNNKNKKKVDARVVGFVPLQHKMSPQQNIQPK